MPLIRRDLDSRQHQDAGSLRCAYRLANMPDRVVVGNPEEIQASRRRRRKDFPWPGVAIRVAGVAMEIATDPACRGGAAGWTRWNGERKSLDLRWRKPQIEEEFDPIVQATGADLVRAEKNMPDAGPGRPWTIGRSCPVVAHRERKELAPAPAPKPGSAAFSPVFIEQADVEGIPTTQAWIGADPICEGTAEMNLANTARHGERHVDVPSLLPWLEAPGQDKIRGRFVRCRVQGCFSSRQWSYPTGGRRAETLVRPNGGRAIAALRRRLLTLAPLTRL